MTRTKLSRFAPVVAAVSLMAACAADPKALVARGDKFMADGKVPEAAIEYQDAEPTDDGMIVKLVNRSDVACLMVNIEPDLDTTIFVEDNARTILPGETARFDILMRQRDPDVPSQYVEVKALNISMPLVIGW